MGITSRDVLRKAVKEFRKEFNVDINGFTLNSVEECMEALRYIILKAERESKSNVLLDRNLKLKSEIFFLKSQIEKLKEKHEEKINFYKNAVKYFNNEQNDYMLVIEYNKDRQLSQILNFKNKKKWWQFWK